ncbi:MAG TPA: aminotransferase class I/II-fold pyridoxal phosphate-dependent enzyme [Actinomycetota bacterium]
MLDFTSALYLGMEHAGGSLAPWRALTTGVPAALRVPPAAREVEGSLAELQGTERAVLATSTLHAFFDLIPLLAGGKAAIHLDRGAYPIARWGAERAASTFGGGASASTFRHHDPSDLRTHLRRGPRRPIVVADGFCPGCGDTAPVGDYLDATREAGGTLVLDDTQALGILGRNPGAGAPLGIGGGGSLRRHGIEGPDIVVVSSLAKGFGVPMAAVAGGDKAVARFEARSETRVHASPPSLCHIYAGQRALALNQEEGERLRATLTRRILRFRSLTAGLGVSVRGGVFPVQTLVMPAGVDAAGVYARLLASGIRTVLHAPRCGRGLQVSFLVTARHRPADIDRAVETLGAALEAAA